MISRTAQRQQQLREVQRKIRGDSKLMTMPSQKKAALYAFLRTHPYRDALPWLRDQGVETSIRALSKFFERYPATLPNERRMPHQFLIEQLRLGIPGLTEQQTEALELAVKVWLSERLAIVERSKLALLPELARQMRIEASHPGNRFPKSRELLTRWADMLTEILLSTPGERGPKAMAA